MNVYCGFKIPPEAVNFSPKITIEIFGLCCLPLIFLLSGVAVSGVSVAVFAQVLAGFRYGRDDLDVLGLNFRRDLIDVRQSRRHSCMYMYMYCVLVCSV